VSIVVLFGKNFFTFVSMKLRRVILSFSSVLVGVLFLAGSTGITVITHHCSNCGDYSVDAGLFLPPSEPEDDCCEAADIHCEHPETESEQLGSCHFNINQLKLTNFSVTASLIQILVAAEEPVFQYLIAELSSNPKAALPLSLHNKHGGRYTITRNCQLLS
jgi:hypothetical protein